MSDFHDAYKRQLVRAAGELFAPAPANPPRKVRRPRRIPLLAVVALAVLLLAAAALAASRIISFGKPVTASRYPGQERSSVTAGIGVPVAGADGSPASVRLVAVAVPDPGGGLPWGMRIVRTTRGLLCLQIGRLLDGRLGVLGQDGEFDDDGLFHELPASVLNFGTCVSPSDWTILSESGLPAAGALQSPSPSCTAPWLPARASSPPRCPTSDERLVGFGVLGPHAVSVSYMLDGHLRTVATAGRLGAYLIVLRVPPSLARNVPALGGKDGRLGGFPIGAGRGEVLSRMEFRFGGRLCQTGFDRRPAGPPQCKSSTALAGRQVPQIPQGLHTPVALKTRKVAGGYELEVRFTAPMAIESANVAYGVQVRRPNSPACGRGGIWGQSIERDVARGQTLRVTEFVPRAPGCRGVVRGQVVLGVQPGVPRLFGARDETIGRFTFDMR